MPNAYALLGTYPPTKCGLASFSAALLAHLRETGDLVQVVRVVDKPSPCRAPEVVHHLVRGCAASAAATAAVLNGYDAVLVQHEYGIYGGPDGQDVATLLAALRVPTVVVVHTVLTRPTPRQRRILTSITEAASAVVTMTQTARERLELIYATDPAKISVIPHGSPDRRPTAAPSRGNPGPTALTWGLLGPGKGVEYAIDAIALLRDRGVRVAYTIAGQTHPHVRARDGETYRRGLAGRAASHGIADLVRFDARYLPADALTSLISAADVIVLPYESPDQVTSGVLIEAVAAGKPVVSTSFPHAVELLAGGAGLLVRQRDAAGLADAVMRVVTEPGLAARMSRQADRIAPTLLWPAVAESYRQLMTRLISQGVGV
jgi:polysaccharide biosynthesis protein PslF